jgi:subtilase family serine protease
MIRRLSTSSLVIIGLVSVMSIACLAQPRPLLTRHLREVTVNGQAQLIGRLPASEIMRLVLVLPLRNQARLDDFMKELYKPSSPSYREFLTVDEFTRLFGPTPEDYSTVVRWAETNGFTVVGTSRNRVNLDVMGSVGTIEAALQVNLGVYQHPTEKRTFYAPDREPTPDLPFPLWRIAGLDNYSLPHPALTPRPAEVVSQTTTGSCPDQSFCGSDMRAAYYEGTALTGKGQSLGLLEYAGTDLADLDTYYKNAHQTNHVPITLLSTDGTSTSCVYPGCDDTEQTLDMTQALGMAPSMSSLVMYIGSTDAAIFNAMATARPLNAQLSSSWTWSPPDSNTDNPYFEEFAAQGQNLFQAAGDSGAWTPSSEIYPADDVYLTSVGGTDLETSSGGGPWKSETAWVDGGGGVSPDRFAIPYWQTQTASACADCSTTLRNGPDVSGNANFTFYVCADQQPCTANFYGGTSFAAPMWAGYLALANEQAVASGQHTLGFINPTLYNIGMSSSFDNDFHDVISGSNGYPATVGYDLATGWGSPMAGTGLINALIAPGFFLSASPFSQTVFQGKSVATTYSVTITSLNGFSGTVDLSSSCPSSITCTLSARSVTVSARGTATSTLTASTNGTTPSGTYSLAVTGTSGSLSRRVSVNLVVMVPFSFSSNPTATSVDQGGTAKYTETLKSLNAFSGSVTLSVTGCPPSSGCRFSPNPVTVPSGGSGSSTFSVATGKNTPTGTYTMTLAGTSGSLKHSVTVQLTVFKE